jgi:hypothetical protein
MQVHLEQQSEHNTACALLSALSPHPLTPHHPQQTLSTERDPGGPLHLP